MNKPLHALAVAAIAALGTFSSAAWAQAAGSIVVRGRVPVHEVNRELGIELPESPQWSTMGGLAIALAGSLPVAGARLDAGHGTTLEVVEASERRVQCVRIRTARRPRQPSQHA